MGGGFHHRRLVRLQPFRRQQRQTQGVVFGAFRTPVIRADGSHVRDMRVFLIQPAAHLFTAHSPRASEPANSRHKRRNKLQSVTGTLCVGNWTGVNTQPLSV